jgi:hypothetical protein
MRKFIFLILFLMVFVPLIYAAPPVQIVDGDGNPVTITSNTLDTNTDLNPASSIVAGVKAVSPAGTAVALATSTAITSVKVKAYYGNKANIYVGPSTVTAANGYILATGIEVTIDVDNLADVYVNAAINNDSVTYLATIK